MTAAMRAATRATMRARQRQLTDVVVWCVSRWCAADDMDTEGQRIALVHQVAMRSAVTLTHTCHWSLRHYNTLSHAETERDEGMSR